MNVCGKRPVSYMLSILFYLLGGHALILNCLLHSHNLSNVQLMAVCKLQFWTSPVYSYVVARSMFLLWCVSEFMYRVSVVAIGGLIYWINIQDGLGSRVDFSDGVSFTAMLFGGASKVCNIARLNYQS